ncbi:MAG: DUF3500 domain-containing protein [Chitinophagaceae bacterium]|nr:DUF3500 domain-containing protein [Chitinophagaceae bacterium]
MYKNFFLACIVCCSLQSSFSQSNMQEIKKASLTFIDSLTAFQKKRAMLAYSDTDRIKWNNLPVGLRARAGINIGSLSDNQRKLVHRMLSASLSSQGYLKATSIMHLDNLLNMYFDTLYSRKEIDDNTLKFLRDLKWSHQNYYLAFFGDPQKDTDWGYKLEGHHLSLNFTFHDDKLSVTPMFVGTDPAEYPITEYAGWRVLGYEEDYGIKLLRSLSPAQKKAAVKSTEVPGDIITAAESGKRLVDYWGIKGTSLNKKQQELLERIIREFVYNLEYDKAVTEYNKIVKAGIQNIYFGWIGENDETKPHYYILNGPTFIIEFDNNGGPRRQANHIHAIWREKGNEYGEDVLKKHYEAEHKKP